MSEDDRKDGGITLVEMMVAITILAVAVLVLGGALHTGLRNSRMLREDTLTLATCEQVLQETVQRPFAQLEAYNPPAAPAETADIATFSVPGVNGAQGSVRLSKVKNDSTTGAKLFRIRVFFPSTGAPFCQLQTYVAKKIK